MKKLILSTVLLAGLSLSVYGQGTVILDNTANTGTSLGATSNGVVFVNGVLLSGDVNLTLSGGLDSGSQSPIISIFGPTAAGDGFGGGLFSDPSGNSYVVAGVALGGTAVLHLQAWIGSDTTYGAAVSAGAFAADSGFFNNPTGGNGAPPAVPSSLIGMPSMNLVAVPEPSTFALIGFGTGALLFFRRRK